MMQIASANWNKTGNIFGTNEIMGLMFGRDVMVLGLADGVMCASTGLGLILQKLIQNGWLEWNKSGWILQSVGLLSVDTQLLCALYFVFTVLTSIRCGSCSTFLLCLDGRYFANGHGPILSSLCFMA